MTHSHNKKRDNNSLLKISRENLFQNLFFPGKYIYFQTNRPYARVQATMNIVGSNLYLFGGLNSERLKDMWKCDVENGKNLNKF